MEPPQPISSDDSQQTQTVSEKQAGKQKVKSTKRKVPRSVSSDSEEKQTVNETKAGKQKVKQKKRKLTGKCWQHFEVFYDEDKKRKGRCKYCGNELCAESGKDGTSSLNKHANNCKQNPANMDKSQPNLVLNKNEDGQGTLKTWKFDPDKIRKLLVKMIIVDELPFSFVEREGFKEFMEALCPNFKLPSRFTVAHDILDYFLEEKKKLRDFFVNNKQRVSFTTDTWTSIQRVNYMCLTAHFIDNNWQYHKRIISFKQILSHKGEDIAGAIEECLVEWGIEKVMTMTMDNASSNDAAVRKLKSSLPELLVDGKYFHVRCVAHVINLIVQDGLNKQDDILTCIRDIVKHIRSSPARLATFKSCVAEKKLDVKGLVSLDVSTRWNSTYDMLDRALQLEKAIDVYVRLDSSCRKELDHVPDRSIWAYARQLKRILELFKTKTVELSCSNYVIAHEVYAEVLEVGEHLNTIKNEPDQINSFVTMIPGMIRKFEKYFEDDLRTNKLFEFASIFDPRVKLTLVELVCQKKCNLLKEAGVFKTTDDFEKRLNEMLDEVKFELQKTLNEYEVINHAGSSNMVTTETQVEQIRGKKSWMGQLERFRGVGQSSSKKTELERYLQEDHEEMRDHFDILNWWNVNSTRYPTLARLVKDLLAIPISTVASESAFSTGGRVIEEHRSSLSPNIVEALICTQDWIRKGRKEINEDEYCEKFDEFAKDVFDKVESMKMGL